MKFETEYKNINFHITLESVEKSDITLLLGDKFNRLPSQTLIELKKGRLLPFHLIIRSSKENEERTHYWSNVLLMNDPENLLEELGQFLDDEEILESIVKNWELKGDESGPHYKKEGPKNSD